MKIVINTCHGGFGLSEKAMKEYFRLKGWPFYVEEKPLFNTHWKVPLSERVQEIDWKNATEEEKIAYNEKFEKQTCYEGDIERNDPDLIRAIETVGTEEASGGYASLKIVEIPDDVEWEIEEYDGSEWIAEKHRIWS